MKREEYRVADLLRDLLTCAVFVVVLVAGSYLVLTHMADEQGRYEQVN